ncbi:hypothetical protein HZA97_02285 [Candidatus Woesearchaeota archaeon]|nr:hypothetical protein [Candidatus Woesearchaeota archaeon]
MDKFQELRNKYLKSTKEKVRTTSFRGDFILQSFKSIKELENIINLLCSKLREWYACYYPELEKSARNNEEFLKKIIENPERKTSMGMEDCNKEDTSILITFAKNIKNLFEQKIELEKYLEKLLEDFCPNIRAIAGNTITCLMIEQMGSLKKLMGMPASTIQILGAEKALFRHLKGEGRSPKFGFLYGHELVKKSRDNKGKVAKLLADKISIAAKIDYFKGKFIGDKLRKEVEEKSKYC